MLTKLAKLREERERGFTLIELLVVILIIGILAAIAIPAFLNQRKSAVDSTVESDLTSVAKAVEAEAIKLKGQPAQVSGDTSLGQPLQVGDKVIPLNDLKSAEDTDLKLEGTLGSSEGYTITGINKNGDVASSGIVYNSATGGLPKGSSGTGGAVAGALSMTGTLTYDPEGMGMGEEIPYSLSLDRATGAINFSVQSSYTFNKIEGGVIFHMKDGSQINDGFMPNGANSIRWINGRPTVDLNEVTRITPSDYNWIVLNS